MRPTKTQTLKVSNGYIACKVDTNGTLFIEKAISKTFRVLLHTTLDRAVLTAYGWPEHLSDDDILERLLALNLERGGD